MSKKLFCSVLLVLSLVGACDDGEEAAEGITEVKAGEGLTGSESDGVVTLELDTSALQQRIDGTCSGDTAVQSVAADGTVSCSSAMAAASHDHGTQYAATSHDHDSDYSALGHDHASLYAALSHDHAGVYSVEGHNHDTAYAPSAHDHDGVYSVEGHNHDTAYAPSAHDHDADYLPTADFNGHNSGTCANDGGYVVIGNMQEEFGCSVTCGDMCANHGLTCERAYTVSGVYRTCTSINNNEALYCWCKA